MTRYAIRHVNTVAGVSFYVTCQPKHVVECDETVRQIVSHTLQLVEKGMRHPRVLLYSLDAPDGQEVSTQVCWQSDDGQLTILREVPEEQPT